MPRCFVIQPFDRGKFDKRYRDTFKPAIEAAGLEAYRVDQDPAVAVPIEEIEAGIRSATVCFAEITTDNPNVWFELGFARAERKPIIMVCSDERPGQRYPFDIQHRTVIPYATESPNDFAELSHQVTARLTALLDKEATIEAAAQPSPLLPVEGLEQQEIVTLVTIAENVDVTTDDLISVHTIRQDMERAGFSRIAVTLALKVLLEKGMIETGEVQGWNESYRGYGVTETGFQWLLSNKNLLNLRSQPKPTSPSEAAEARRSGEDDIPF